MNRTTPQNVVTMKLPQKPTVNHRNSLLKTPTVYTLLHFCAHSKKLLPWWNCGTQYCYGLNLLVTIEILAIMCVKFCAN